MAIRPFTPAILLSSLIFAACGSSATAPTSAPASTSPSAKPAASAGASAAAKTSGSASTAASGLLAMKSAYTTTSGTQIPQWIAKEAGLFAQNGLDVSLSVIAPGAPILAALESGDVPISNAGGQEVVNA